MHFVHIKELLSANIVAKNMHGNEGHLHSHVL